MRLEHPWGGYVRNINICIIIIIIQNQLKDFDQKLLHLSILVLLKICNW